VVIPRVRCLSGRDLTFVSAKPAASGMTGWLLNAHSLQLHDKVYVYLPELTKE
jgi:hypothetical protein